MSYETSQCSAVLLWPEGHSVISFTIALNQIFVVVMSNFTGVLKGGWHPKGKDGGRGELERGLQGCQSSGKQSPNEDNGIPKGTYDMLIYSGWLNWKG